MEIPHTHTERKREKENVIFFFLLFLKWRNDFNTRARNKTAQWQKRKWRLTRLSWHNRHRLAGKDLSIEIWQMWCFQGLFDLMPFHSLFLTSNTQFVDFFFPFICFLLLFRDCQSFEKEIVKFLQLLSGLGGRFKHHSNQSFSWIDLKLIQLMSDCRCKWMVSLSPGPRGRPEAISYTRHALIHLTAWQHAVIYRAEHQLCMF